MTATLDDVHGRLLVVRPPVPATVNKAGANYKSEIAHLEYSPRRAYDEWLAICEAIVACGGDALFEWEAADEPLLDCDALELAADGTLRRAGSREPLAHIDDVHTGRVFTANGPWVTVERRRLRALLPNMVAHRRDEQAYFTRLLSRIAEDGGYELELASNPHRWEGMADVAVVGDQVILTHTVRGHYDQAVGSRTLRSSRAGGEHAAEHAFVPDGARVFAELIYPHFHGDTVHFAARRPGGAPVLMQYPGGLWGDGAERIARAVGGAVIPIDRDDAVERYAANSRQVGDGILVPAGANARFTGELARLGLTAHSIELFELFGKAGGGPACATLQLPASLDLPPEAPIRYSVRCAEARARRNRIPARLTVAPAFFTRPRG